MELIRGGREACRVINEHRERDSVETENEPDWRWVRRGESPGSSISNSLPGGNSEREPPDPIPNSEVKTLCADGSVAASHARVGHCQALNPKRPSCRKARGAFLISASI